MNRSFTQFVKGMKSTKYTATTIKISPALAKEMLKKNKSNRKFSVLRAARLAEDMASGLWRRTGEAISFLRNGNLLSGQHRLNAIIQSGTTQEFTVAFCADEDATMYEGMGTKFTANDHLSRNGFKELSSLNGGAIIRHMRFAFSNPRGSMRAHEVISFANKYKEAVSFAAQCFQGIRDRRIAIAPILAVIARAYVAKPSKRADIKRFCTIMRDGVIPKTAMGKPLIIEDRDRCPMAMRELLIQQRNHRAADICQTYRKMETALVRFMTEREVTAPLFGSREELFAIPEDEMPRQSEASSTRYFCIPTKALNVNVLTVPTMKAFVNKQVIPLRNKKMTRVMRTNDKFCILGFNGKGYTARISGSIKKVDVKGKDVKILVKESQLINGPLINSVRSSLTSLNKDMPVRVFAASIRALDQRDFERIVKP